MRVGEFDLGAKGADRRGFDLEIKEVVVHPFYEKGKPDLDVAVIVTNRIEFTPFLRPICLPSKESTDGDEYADKLVELTGNQSLDTKC